MSLKASIEIPVCYQQMKNIILILSLMFLASCSYSVKPPEPVGQYPATVRVVVSGLSRNALLPNDVVWLNVFKNASVTNSEPFAKERLTLDNPIVNYRLESDKTYSFHFEGVAPILGGMKTCRVNKTLDLKKSEQIKLVYKSLPGKCTITPEKL